MASTKFVRSLLVLALMLAGMPLRAEDEKPILVFAAVSLKDALEPIARAFETETGMTVEFSFAGTPTLARQIAAGAPADLFISADIDWATWLQAHNFIMPETQRIIAYNRLALIAPAESVIAQTPDIAAILQEWQARGRERIAVADPDNVPAGRYARSALKALEDRIGPYETLKERFAIAGNVRLALLLVARGEVPLGIVYRSDALIEPRVKIVGTFPPESHADIVYPAVRTLRGRPEADAFLAYLGSEMARMQLQKAGLSLPLKGL